MIEQNTKADAFRALHVRGWPLLLFNIWDAGTAKAVAAAGASAIATGSWSVAAANGFQDGEHLSLGFAIDNLMRIARATELPVTIDIESGYGKTAGDVGRTIAQTIAAGAVGCNLEDSFPESGKLREAKAQVERIRSARKAAEASNIHYFINARTDVFFQAGATEHNETMLRAAADRASAYADAGADGLFAPGLIDESLIAQLARISPLPMNIMVGDGTPTLETLAELGVARISYGPVPYLTLMESLREQASTAIRLASARADNVASGQ